MRNSLRSVLFMFFITLIFTALVSGVRSLSENRIRLNREVKLQRTILGVLDIQPPAGITDRELGAFFAARVQPVEIRGTILYIGTREDGNTVQGYAFPVGGPGFWGPIEGMAAVNADATRILGLAFSRHSETPGLGGRITETWFTDQFKGLPLFPVEGDRNIFFLRLPGTARASNQLDAVTGATNTSSAVERFLNDGLDAFLKNLWTELKTRN